MSLSNDALSDAEVRRLIERLASAMISDDEAIGLIMAEPPLAIPSTNHHRKTSDYRTTDLDCEE